MAMLFEPIALRSLVLPNRVVIAPMCEFSAVDGCASDWHIIHLGHLAVSGAGLLIIEATGVEPAGRISRECLGLYSDENEEALARVLKIVRKYASMPIGIQLSHAGRKASIRKPADGRGPAGEEEGGWEVVAPSPIPFAETWKTPRMLDRAGMDSVISNFVQATKRADRLGLDLLELHSAHGYLMSSYLSPIANVRTDEYGGSLENRMRFPLEIFKAVREAWPDHKPAGVRFNGSDWLEGGIDPDEAVAYAKALAAIGCDYVDVSSGGNGYANIPLSPGYQVPFAERVKRETGLPTMAVGLIREPSHAEQILQDGMADMIALGRGILNNPRWPWHAAEELGAVVEAPHQYMRAVTRTGLPTQDSTGVPSHIAQLRESRG
ncbi:NADH:flavin oxidoreductase/NADH oxidase [Microvirga pudoricolor]|uniref:NADH:flavin oxidoreductase/NADH oxidase n=1 Tax=Microvirga pudoricolor TaxID=2778729 RepID=UPI001E345C84|nr:NADH:flavin oxidoreductase/NADH oxidase [Microvirga pudoricolor]